MTETIVRAAAKLGTAVYSVPQPGRHHNVIYDEVPAGLFVGPDEQGFLTSTGRFVDREEGLAIAKAAGQIKEKVGNARILFSEDLW